MKFIPKKIAEGINITKRHPLSNLAHLLGMVIIIGVIGFVLLGVTADLLSRWISPDMEDKIGNTLLTMVADNEIQDEKRIKYLTELIYSLPKKDEELRLPLKLHLIESDVVNAFVIAGGHIFIHTALLKTVQSENELAFVLAHELGHFQERHPINGLGRGIIFMVVANILNFGTHGAIPDILSIGSNLYLMNYSRKQETAADLYALERIINRYGHGGHTMEFFKRLEKDEAEGSLVKVSEYFSTHPRSKERIERLMLEAEKQNWKMQGDAHSITSAFLRR
jgi:predicted Zn-dependent protease